ncbi:MAG TPA: hypothetical protein VFC71_02065 [Candidatus Polarisedimenticolia bacterium]|nr:hypothetical protein [Candidatus Polarisedimenticolia bacterium]
MIRRLLAAGFAAALVASLSISVALAGEVTGNGKVLTVEQSKWGTGVHGRSLCAYSGQEDLQFFVDEETDSEPVANVVKGVPGHAQSWGQIPKADRDFLTSIGHSPGVACNPTKSGGE